MTMPLGRVKVTDLRLYGLYERGVICVDTAQGEQDRLGTLVHELLHHICPRKSEAWVSRRAEVMARVLWRQGYRRR